MKGKKCLSLLLALVLVFTLSACGGSSSQTDGNSNGGTDAAANEGGYKTDTLIVNIWDNNQRAGLQQIADEWSAKSGVSVKVEVISWDAYWTLLEAGATGGNLPDVFWMHINEAQKYMAGNILLNLDSYIAADDQNPSSMADVCRDVAGKMNDILAQER